MSAPFCTDCRHHSAGYCCHRSNLSPADGKPEDSCRVQRIGPWFMALLFCKCGPWAFFFEPKESK